MTQSKSGARRARAVGVACLAAALGWQANGHAAPPPEEIEQALIAAPSDQRLELYRRLIGSVLESRNALSDRSGRLERGVVGFASIACAGNGTAAATDTPGDHGDMLQAIETALASADAEAAAQADGGNAALHAEALLALAQCYTAVRDDDGAGRLFRAATDFATTLDAPAAGPVRARVADAAGLAGALPPERVIALADGLNAPHYEAVIVRAWALDTLIQRGDVGQVTVRGVYAPTGIDNDTLAEQADAALDLEDPLSGFLFAAAIDVSLDDRRKPLLQRAFDAFMAAGDQAAARLAARAVVDASDRSDWLETMAARALEAGLPADAEYAARLMQPTRNTLNVWLDIATAYREADYQQPLDAALEAALQIGAGLADIDNGSALMLATGRAAQLDRVDRAAAILTELPEAEDRNRAVADLAKRLAELDRIDEALEWAAQIDDTSVDPEIRARAFGPIAKHLAEQGRLDEAMLMLSTRPDLAGRYVDPALRTVAVELVRADRTNEAAGIVDQIEDPEERARAEAEIARAQGDAALGQLIRQRTEAALAIVDSALRADALRATAELMVEAGALAALRELRSRALAAHPSSAEALDAIVAPALAVSGAFDEAEAVLGGLSEGPELDRARSSVGIALAERGRLGESVGIVRDIRDPLLRLTTFRYIAELQALRLDRHAMIPEVYASRPAGSVLGDTGDAVGADAQQPLVPSYLRAGEVVVELPEAELADWPDLTGLRSRVAVLASTPATVRQRIRTATADAATLRLPATGTPYNEKFIEIVPIVDYAQRQGEPVPQVIYLDRGTETLSSLREALIRLGRPDYLEVSGTVYTLRRPLVIGPHATLVVSGADVGEMRLSTLDYSYIINGGTLVIADTRITSWDTDAGTPSDIELGVNEFLFRPFITSWSGSETYATRSLFRALGYNNRKSWGFTVTAGPQDFMSEGEIALPSPRVQAIENVFERLYYGFYSYHALGSDIIGNEYRNNVIYGPDPHDYSDDILIALNSAYGTQKKHGLIASREVSGYFIGNLAFDNSGAGIMLDRLSNNSIIYANSAFSNGNDGISVYETACAIVASNESWNNAYSGLRVRNSVDVGVFDNALTDNRKEGAIAYTDRLIEHTWRNLELDPFWTIASASFVNNRITGNGGALRLDDVFAVTLVDNAMSDNGAEPLVGSFQPVLAFLVRKFQLSDSALLLVDLCQRPLERYRPCTFRQSGVFGFDGQDDWQFGDTTADCSGNYSVSSQGLVREPGL